MKVVPKKTNQQVPAMVKVQSMTEAPKIKPGGVPDSSPILTLAQLAVFKNWQVNEPGRNFEVEADGRLAVAGPNIFPWYFGSMTVGLKTGTLREGAIFTFDLEVREKNSNAQVAVELFQDTDGNGQILKYPEHNWVPLSDADWVAYTGEQGVGEYQIEIPIVRDSFQVHPNQAPLVTETTWAPEKTLCLQFNVVAAGGEGAGMVEMTVSNFRVVV